MMIGKACALYQRRLRKPTPWILSTSSPTPCPAFRCPESAEYYQNRFRYILVDEYQDTNRAQHQLIAAPAKQKSRRR